MEAMTMEQYNPNYISGDINGGVHGMCGYHAAHAALKEMI
jgi:hypothetical protein